MTSVAPVFSEEDGRVRPEKEEQGGRKEDGRSHPEGEEEDGLFRPEGETQLDGRKLESWYFMFSLGYIAQNKLEEVSFDTDIKLALDMRVYLPFSEHALAGAGINFASFQSSDSEIAVNFLLYSLSLEYYFKFIGDGFFLRADLGGAKLVVTAGEVSASTDWGYGFLIGAGYALPISSESSILIYGTYRALDLDGAAYSDIALQVGCLW